MITHEIGVSSESRPDKMVLVYRSKAALLRKHWPTPKRQLGLALLWTGVGLRALVGRVRSTRDGAATWRAVWGARRNWLKGYPQPLAGQLSAGRVRRTRADRPWLRSRSVTRCSGLSP